MKGASVALVGNPNCGKTTLFNGLTGSSQHIGNWPGVTVEEKSGVLLGSDGVEVVDLPGIYSLNAASEDERVARDHILADDFDLIVNIIDATHLERNLLLTTTLLELGKPILLVFNMIDLAKKKGLDIDVDGFSEALGAPAVGVNALNGAEVRDLRRALNAARETPTVPGDRIVFPSSIEDLLALWTEEPKGCSRIEALMLLDEDDEAVARAVNDGPFTRTELDETRVVLENELGNPPDIVMAETRYRYIEELTRRLTSSRKSDRSLTEKIDRVALHKGLGLPIFLAVIYLLFWAVTNVGGAFIDFFDILFGAFFVDGFGILLDRLGSPEWLTVLLADGVGGGIRTVATFVPIIFMMFFLLSLLEDSGYLARASYIMDRFMRVIGLPGKAFVPMLVGFGCTVPAVMATRTLEDKKDRYLTVFMAPFMSCGARLPVYALFGTAFFGRYAGLMVVSLYVMGILMAIVTAFLLKNTLFKGEAAHFAMELPPYHAPRLSAIMQRTWFRLKDFVGRAGQVIVIAVLVLSFFNSLGTDGSFGNEDGEHSVLAAAGRHITPLFHPMGMEDENWPATVGLMTGIFAKEAIVGTMNSLYGQIDAAGRERRATSGVTSFGKDRSGVGAVPSEDETAFSLGRSALTALRSIPEGLAGIFGGFADPLGATVVGGKEAAVAQEIGAKVGTFAALSRSFGNDWARAYAYLLFVLLYFPCIAAMSTIIREIGPKFGALAMIYLTVLAWSVATLFFQIARGHSVLWMAVATGLVVLFIPIFNAVSGRWGLRGASD